MTRIEPNPAQKRAIEHRDGPLFISAGAGSGKTRVLVERVIAALLDPDDPVDPRRILSITFTRKAAQELLDRVVRALEDHGRHDLARRVDEMWISTIHGAAARLLKEQALVIGLDPGFVQIDEVTTARMREEALVGTLERYRDAPGAMRRLLDAHTDIRKLMPAVIGLARAIAQGDSIRHETAPQDAGATLGEAVERIDELNRRLQELMCAPDQEACAYTKKNLGGALAAIAADLAALRFTGDMDTDESTFDRAEALVGTYRDKKLNREEYLGRDIHLEARQVLGRLRSDLNAIRVRPLALALEEFARDWHDRFAAIKERAAALDYDDLLIRARDALRDHPGIAAEYDGRFVLAQIDEFQDTNELQRDFVKRLAGDSLATVGDAQQAIYAFQGADIEVYRRHAREMDEAGAVQVELEDNYRSRPEILDLVNHLFGGSDPALGRDFLRLGSGRYAAEAQRAALGGGPSLEFVVLVKSGSRGEGETQSLRTAAALEFADRVRALVDAGVDPGDIVALVPARTHVKHYVSALAERGIEAASTGGEYYRTPPVKLAGAFVRVLANARDEASLIALLASDVFGASDDELISVSREACAGDPGRIAIDRLLEDPLTEPDDVPAGSCPAPEVRIAALPASIAHARAVLVDARAAVHESSLSSVIRTAIERSGWLERLLTRGEQGRVDIASILQFIRIVQRFEREGGSGLHDLLQTLSALEEYATDVGAPTLPSPDRGVVRFMTIHGAKGLEFKHVFVLEAQHWKGPGGVITRDRPGELLVAFPREDDLWKDGTTQSLPTIGGFAYPALRRQVEVAARDEKLHVLYVALTRAEETLTVIGETSGAVGPYDPVSSSHPMMDLMLDRLLPHGDLVVGSFDAALSDSDSVARVTVVGVEARASEAAETPDRGDEEPVTRSHQPSLESSSPTPSSDPPARRPSRDPVPQRISYSGFAAYHSCARRFRYERIIRIGRLSLATQRSEALDFGSAFHALAELAGRHGDGFARSRAAAVAAGFGVPADRIPELEAAFDVWRASEVAEHTRRAERIGFEAPFTLTISGDDIPAFDLDGSIDLYARTGGDALIVDYKTGGTSDQAGDPDVIATLVERYRLQASCYALAAVRDGATAVHVVFIRPQVVDVAGRMQTIEYRFTSSDAERIESELIDSYRRMVRQEFEPLTEYSSDECGSCPIAGTICSVGSPALSRG